MKAPTQGFAPFIKKATQKLVPDGAEIRELELPALVEGNTPSYGKIRATFKTDLTTRDARFALSELVANQMSVEQEEQRRFEKRVGDVVEERVKKLHDEVHAAAYKEGFETGRKEAFEVERARLAVQLEAMATVVTSLTKAKVSLGEQYEQQLVEMAFKLARIIVHTEIRIRPAAISATVIDILGRIAKDDDVMVRLSPVEFEAIEQIHDDIKQVVRQGRVSFEVDQRLQPGNCIVESLSGEIASVIDDKFNKLQTEVAKVVRQDFESTGT